MTAARHDKPAIAALLLRADADAADPLQQEDQGQEEDHQEQQETLRAQKVCPCTIFQSVIEKMVCSFLGKSTISEKRSNPVCAVTALNTRGIPSVC